MNVENNNNTIGDILDGALCIDELGECTYDDEEVDYDFFNNNVTQISNDIPNSLEIKFKVKDGFSSLLRAIGRFEDELDNVIIYQNTLSLLDIISCIDIKTRTVNKHKLYGYLKLRYRERFKSAKKKAKKYLAGYMSKQNEADGTFLGLSTWDADIKVREIIEKDDTVYCRVEMELTYLKDERRLNNLGSFIETYAKEVVEAVEIGLKDFQNTYKLLKHEVKGNMLTAYDVSGKDISIKLVDKTKVFMVEANIRLPEIMSNVIKQVDKVDKAIESTREIRHADQYALGITYEKLMYNYDLSIAYLKEKAYTAQLCESRDYEIDAMLKDLDENIKNFMTKEAKKFNKDTLNLNDFNPECELTSKLVKADVNSFSDDYTHWMFKGTFTNIDRDILEKMFKDIKDNVQSKGVHEQDINIRVTEIQ